MTRPGERPPTVTVPASLHPVFDEIAPAPSTCHHALSEIAALHDRCGVYTEAAVVSDILDRVGWRRDTDLYGSRLLEPAAGDGAFVREAASRLVDSFECHCRPLEFEGLADSISAWELHPNEAEKARAGVVALLTRKGVLQATAMRLALRWVRIGDFLLSSEGGSYSHAVGNPPYVRWSKIPRALKAVYEKHLPKELTGGDLFLPFLDRSLAALKEGGNCGFVCSDRWRYMAFAERFRRSWLPRLDIQSNQEIDAQAAFVDKVDIYPTVLIATRRRVPQEQTSPRRGERKTLAEAGYVVKVGPALGCTPAFVLGPDENDVEEDLLCPWMDGSEIGDGTINPKGRRVVSMYDERGLLDPERHPLLLNRLKRYRTALEQRSIVKNGAPWYRPIDRLRSSDWSRPKIVIPELAKTPRVALDVSGAVPSHGVYAIFAPDDDIYYLYDHLSRGGLARCLKGMAPKVKGGYVRCYKRFLDRIEIP